MKNGQPSRKKFIRITNKTTDQTETKLNEKEKAILAYLHQKSDNTQQEIALATALSLSTIKYYTKKLQEKGCLQRMGTHRKGYWDVLYR